MRRQARAPREADELRKKRLLEASEDQVKEESPRACNERVGLFSLPALAGAHGQYEKGLPKLPMSTAPRVARRETLRRLAAEEQPEP